MNREERRRQNKEEADRLAQETLDKMKERREQRKESIQNKWQEADKGKVIKIGIIALSACLVILGIVNVVMTNKALANREMEANSLREQIAAKQTEIDNLNLTPLEQQYVQETLNTCLQQGSAVAEYQNQYATLLRDKKYASTPEIENNIVNVANNLAPYFTGSGDGTVIWYYTSDSNTETQYTWTFETTYGFKGDSIPVLWICRQDNTGTILAYATATYVVANQKFTGIEHYITVVGYEIGGIQNDAATDTPTEDTTKVDRSLVDDNNNVRLNVDTDGNGVPDTNVDADGDGVIDNDKDADGVQDVPSPTTAPSGGDTYERDEDRGEGDNGNTGGTPAQPSEVAPSETSPDGSTGRGATYKHPTLGRNVYEENGHIYDANSDIDLTDALNNPDKYPNFRWDDLRASYVYDSNGDTEIYNKHK